MAKGGGFKGMPGNLQGLMQQAQKMQDELQKAQSQAKLEVVEAQAGGGMVKIRLDGNYRIVLLDIDPDVIDPTDKEMLQDLIKAAFADAVQQVQEKIKSAVSKVTGGVEIPGMF